MKAFKYKGMTVNMWDKSFSIDDCTNVLIGNDNKEEIIKDLIDSIYKKCQKDIQNKLKETLGL